MASRIRPSSPPCTWRARTRSWCWAGGAWPGAGAVLPVGAALAALTMAAILLDAGVTGDLIQRTENELLMFTREKCEAVYGTGFAGVRGGTRSHRVAAGCLHFRGQ